MGMNEWSTPHNSEHWPTTKPIEFILISVAPTLPMSASIFIPRTGPMAPQIPESNFFARHFVFAGAAGLGNNGPRPFF